MLIVIFMEMMATMVIMVPIIVTAGIDPMQFGIVVVVVLVIGALTPPWRMLIFIRARVSYISPNHVFRAAVPFLVAFVQVVSYGLAGRIGP